jgi:hypothetical protein
MAGHGAVGGLGRPVADHDHVGDATRVLVAAPATPGCSAGTQAAGQFPAQLTAALHEQCLVDGLVAHPHHGIGGELDAQAAGDLLR